MNNLTLFISDLPADQNPAIVYLRRLAKGSERTQKSALNAIAYEMSNGKCDLSTFPWHKLRYQHTLAFKAVLQNIGEFAPATINRYLSALRGVLKEAKRLGLMTAEEYSGAVDIENVKYEALPAGRALSEDEISSLINVCLLTGRETGTRDAAIIALMYVTSVRRFELCNLTVKDFDIASGQIRVIEGKGRKSRTAYLGNNAKSHLMNWLRTRGMKPGALFLTVDKLGNLEDKGIQPQSLYDMLERRGKQAGIEDFSPHDIRRTAITELLDRGVDIATVAKIAGHKSLDTTRRYDRRDEKSKRAVTDVFDTPI